MSVQILSANKANFTYILLFSMIGLAGNSLALEADEVPLQDKLHPRTSVDEIARQIRQQPQWRILAAEPVVEDSKMMYRFKLLDKGRGRVKVIVIDPENPDLEQFHQILPKTN